MYVESPLNSANAMIVIVYHELVLFNSKKLNYL